VHVAKTDWNTCFQVENINSVLWGSDGSIPNLGQLSLSSLYIIQYSKMQKLKKMFWKLDLSTSSDKKRLRCTCYTELAVSTMVTCVDASLPFYWRMETHPVSKTQSITQCLNTQKFTDTPKDGKYYFYWTCVKNQIISNSPKFVPCFVIWISVAEHMKCSNACTSALHSGPATMTSSECTIHHIHYLQNTDLTFITVLLLLALFSSVWIVFTFTVTSITAAEFLRYAAGYHQTQTPDLNHVQGHTKCYTVGTEHSLWSSTQM